MHSLAVSPRDRLLFVHVPKTAGTSMRRYLASQYDEAAILPATSWNEYAASGLDAANFRLFSGHFRPNFRAVVPPDTRALVVLRDPVARYVSHLRHAHFSGEFDPLHEQIRHLTLADIIRHPAFGPKWGDAQVRWIAARADPAAVGALLARDPQADLAVLEDGPSDAERLALAQARLEETELIGFTEELDRLADEMCRAMLFHPQARFPVRNVGRNAAIDPRLSADDLAVIRRLTEADAALYRFARDLAARRQRERLVVAITHRGIYSRPTLPFALDLRRPLPGSFWHQPELDGETCWRWTDADGGTTLELAQDLPAGTVCRIGFFDWSLRGRPRLAVTVDGVPRAFALRPREGGYELEFLAVADAASHYCAIALSTLHDPIEPEDARDRRRLGIAVFSIVFDQPNSDQVTDSPEQLRSDRLSGHHDARAM